MSIGSAEATKTALGSDSIRDPARVLGSIKCGAVQSADADHNTAILAAPNHSTFIPTEVTPCWENAKHSAGSIAPNDLLWPGNSTFIALPRGRSGHVAANMSPPRIWTSVLVRRCAECASSSDRERNLG